MAEAEFRTRMIGALERIAAALEEQANPLEGVANMLELAGAPTPEFTGGVDEEGEVDARIELPAFGYSINFTSDARLPEGFLLFLIGPGGQVRPLSW